MRPWKQIILNLYLYGSLPLRTLRNRFAAWRGRAPIMIFTWHRIADDAANGWTTRNDVFANSIAYLQRHYDLISLSEAQERIRSGKNYRLAACVTFDDGYAANCDQAIPLLIREKIPVTYFVTTDPVLSGDYFDHDLLMENHLKVNTVQELREMAAGGIEIGAHTRTHCDIGRTFDESVLYDEIVTAREDLEAAIDRPIRYFAFPFGQHENLNPRAFEIAQDAGFEGTVSAYGGYHYPGDETFHMERMCVDGPLIRFKNWATVDPWKQIKIRSYNKWSEAPSNLSPSDLSSSNSSTGGAVSSGKVVTSNVGVDV